MANAYLKYRLYLSLAIPKNPKNWTGPLLNSIGTEIRQQTAEIILLYREPNLNPAVPTTLSMDSEPCASVHIYTDLCFEILCLKDLSTEVSNRLLMGNGRISSIESLGTNTPTISLYFP